MQQQGSVSPSPLARGERRLSKRQWLRVAGGLVGAAALAGCGPFAPAGQPAPSAAGKAPVAIRWIFGAGYTADMLSRFDEEFRAPQERELPQIRLEVAQGGHNPGDLLAFILSGDLPDVVMHTGSYPGPTREDPTPFIKRDKVDLKVYNQSLLDFMKWDGILWSLPASVGGNGPMWIINRSLFAKENVPLPPDRWNDPAWTWEEAIARARRLTRDTDGDGRVDQWGFGPLSGYHGHARPWDGLWLAHDLKRVLCDSPQMIEAFQLWQDIRCKLRLQPQIGEQPGYGSNVDPILTGTAAIRATGAGSYWTYAAAKDVDWAFCPIPKARLTAPDQTFYGLSIMKGAPHKEEAWQFVKWATSTPYYTLLRRVPPARADLYARWLPAIFGDRAKQLRAHLIEEGLAHAKPSDGIQYHPNYPEMNKDVIAPAIQQLERCETAASAMLRGLKPTLQAIVDRAPVK